ncbi:hypothetical protein CY35_13G089600 [Sphagnum magellanicum]|nr:hypothetical protein CY35_13G089600 [Sphagnum magellanicum]
MDGLYGEDATIMGGGGGAVNPAIKWRDNMARKFQYFLDKSTPHPVARWLGSLAVAAIYCLRAYYIQGFYIVTYGLGIYLLNLLIGFLSPQVDPESEGPALPTKGSDEFKPFIRRLPEFKFWLAAHQAFKPNAHWSLLHVFCACKIDGGTKQDHAFDKEESLRECMR